MMKRITLLFAALTAFAVTGSDASAAFEWKLRVSQGTASQTFDLATQPDIDPDPMVREVVLTGITVGDYLLTVTTSSTNHPGEPFNAFLRLTESTIRRVSTAFSGDLVIEVSATDFTQPSDAFDDFANDYSVTYQPMGALGSTRFESYYVPGGAVFATGPNALTSPTFTDSGGGDQSMNLASGSVPFTLTNIARLSLNETGRANEIVDLGVASAVTAVPVPATMLMALAGLPLMALGLWRRRRAEVQPAKA